MNKVSYLPGHLPAPRCPGGVIDPPYEDLVETAVAVARRPYSQGLHPAWDIQAGERVLLSVTSWHDEECTAASAEAIERAGASVEVKREEKGPAPLMSGEDEVSYYLRRTRELMRWMDEWEVLAREGRYDKVLQGYGGPILGDSTMKIQRMPFITKEMMASPAHRLPMELLSAIDAHTWALVSAASELRITDPEGTDISYEVTPQSYSPDRSLFSREMVSEWYPQNIEYSRKPLPGHIWGRPHFRMPQESGTGVICGTMNHIGPFPYVRLEMENSAIVSVEGGGGYGDNLRAVMEETRGLEYPGFEGRGLLKWWEASIGTNPKIHRPRLNYLTGFCNGLYERVRSGVVHIGFGTVISSGMERKAHQIGLPVGHFHVHLYFPTMRARSAAGGEYDIITSGRLAALDDSAVRECAARFGDPDELLREDWIPAIPGLNLDGDYTEDYAGDPADWTLTELKICRQWHPLFMKMIAAGRI